MGTIILNALKMRLYRFVEITSLFVICLMSACKNQINKIDFNEKKQYVYSVVHEQLQNVLIVSQTDDECYTIERKDMEGGTYYMDFEHITRDYIVSSGCLSIGDTIYTNRVMLKPNKNYEIISVTSSRVPPDTIYIHVDDKGRITKEYEHYRCNNIQNEH